VARVRDAARCTISNVPPLPDLILFSRAECSLCDEARAAIRLVVEDRKGRGLAIPHLVERDIESDPELHRQLIERIPVVELGARRVELIVTVGKLRRLMNDELGETPEATPSASQASSGG
jgi:hypothetical protein